MLKAADLVKINKSLRMLPVHGYGGFAMCTAPPQSTIYLNVLLQMQSFLLTSVFWVACTQDNYTFKR